MTDKIFTILNKAITAATTITTVPFGNIDSYSKGLLLEAVFAYGSGGTTAKAYVQTSIDGTNWIDIACFAFTTASGRKVANLRNEVSVTTIATPTDGTLTDNTVINGIIGRSLQVKYVTTGTYAADTSLVITVKVS